MPRHQKHDSQVAAAVRELVRAKQIRRGDLIIVADKHDANFKTVVKWLEKLEIIEYGTYEQIIGRYGTIAIFRGNVRLAFKENENE